MIVRCDWPDLNGHKITIFPEEASLEHDVDPVDARRAFRIESCTEVAKALAVDAGSAVLQIERTSFTKGHRPIDHERRHYRGDLISFFTRLSRRLHRSS
jgi:GntR family transcriptional regulator